MTESPKSKVKFREEVVNPVHLTRWGRGWMASASYINFRETDSLVTCTALEPNTAWSLQCREGGAQSPRRQAADAPCSRSPNPKKQSRPPRSFLL